MTFTPEFMLSIVVALASGFGAYAAIRSDLATLHERVAQALKDAERAQKRIDQLPKRQTDFLRVAD